MTPHQRIKVVYDYLKKNGPWHGSGWDLCKKTGLSYQELRIVLRTVRSGPWIETNEWTIPFCGQGNAGPYALVEGRATAEAYLLSGQRNRGGDILTAMRNWDAQFDFGTIKLDRRTAEGKWNTLASAQVKAMVALAEALGL